MSATMVLGLMMPSAIEEMMLGESEGMMIGYALFWLIPLVMAVLCLTLKDSLNRWLNFILGILFGLFLIICEIVGHATWGDLVSVALWLMMVAGLVVAFFIALLGWKLPRQEP